MMVDFLFKDSNLLKNYHPRFDGLILFSEFCKKICHQDVTFPQKVNLKRYFSRIHGDNIF